jgi:two-component system NtrC family sensor kinase
VGALPDAERILAYRAVPGEPLVVVLTHDLASVLAPWRRAAISALAALALLALLVAAGVALRVRSAAERQRSRERLAESEKLEALGRLTGGIAHDFGNVLGIIGNNFALLAALPQARDDTVRAAVDTGKRAVATGTRLTRDLMAFARKRELQLARADLSEAIAQMRPILEQAAGPVRIDTSLAVGLHRCELDYTQLQVTMINLVANARHAMADSGIVRIRTYNLERPGAPSRAWGLVRAGGPQPWVGLTVADSGVGMEEDVRRKALEPFFTTKGEQGTGLGLSQVYGFMIQLGGDVAIDSVPGQGTAVHLYFRPLPRQGPGDSENL